MSFYCKALIAGDSLFSKNYTIKDGLHRNSITSMVQDYRGFIWLANNGLVRFDGKNFKKFFNAIIDTNNLQGEACLGVQIIDSCLWATGFAKATKLDLRTYKFEHYTHYIDLQGKRNIIQECTSICKDVKGDYWLGTTYNGLLKFDKQKKIFVEVAPLPNKYITQYNWVTSILELPDHRKIFGTTKALVIMQDDQHISYIPYPKKYETQKEIRTKTMPYDKQYPNDIWINLGAYGLYKFNLVDQSFEQTKLFNLNYSEYERWLNFAFNNEPNNIVLNDRILELDKQSNILSKGNKFNNYGAMLACYFTDKENNIWLGSYGAGLFRIQKETPIVSTEFTKSAVNLHLIKDKTKIYGTEVYHNTQILELAKSGTRVNAQYPLKTIHVPEHFYKFGDTFIWSAYNGLFYKSKNDKIPKQLITNEKYLSPTQVHQFQNKLLLSNYANGPFIYHLHNATYKKLYCARSSNTKVQACYAASFDSKGNIWAMPNLTDTLYNYNDTGKLIQTIPIPSTYFKKNAFRSYVDLVIDNYDNIWIFAYEVGIIRYNLRTRKLEKLNIADELVAMRFDQAVYDGKQTIWLGCNDGLLALDIVSKSIKRYDGLYNLPAGNLYSVRKYNEDTILATTFDGNFYLLKHGSKKFLPTPYLYLDNPEINNKFSLQNSEITNKVVLEPGVSNVQLNFGLVQTNFDEDVTYQIKINGLDKQWRALGSQSNLLLTNLSPGTYKVALQASVASESFEPAYREFLLIVHPKWHQTLLFKLLSIFALASLIYAAVRYYLNNKLKQQQALLDKQTALLNERNRIASDMHDDLGAGLSQISYLSKSAMQQTNNETLKIILQKTKANSDTLVEKMNEIIWSLSEKDASLDELYATIRANFAELLSSVDMQYDFNFPEQVPDLALTSVQKRNIYLVSKEAVHNAIKHAKAKTVNFSSMYENNILTLIVQDDGKGFDQTLVSGSGNGLHNYRKRMEAINGSAFVDSNSSGTRVTFTIKM
jgi:signal transduction histidine kinase